MTNNKPKEYSQCNDCFDGDHCMGLVFKCKCPCHPEIVEVTIEDENTPLGFFQKVRTEAITEMFNGMEKNGIYPTSNFFAKLDDCVRSTLEAARSEWETAHADECNGHIEKVLGELEKEIENMKFDSVRATIGFGYNAALEDVVSLIKKKKL